MSTQVCKKCGCSQPLEEFVRSKASGTTNNSPNCASCQKKDADYKKKLREPKKKRKRQDEQPAESILDRLIDWDTKGAVDVMGIADWSDYCDASDGVKQKADAIARAVGAWMHLKWK